MTDLPTLIVHGDPEVWLDQGITAHHLRIDGPLPTVEWLDISDPNTVSGGHRPLDVGDRVTLATVEPPDPDGIDNRVRPFATATVANMRGGHQRGEEFWIVTVTNVKELT